MLNRNTVKFSGKGTYIGQNSGVNEATENQVTVFLLFFFERKCRFSNVISTVLAITRWLVLIITNNPLAANKLTQYDLEYSEISYLDVLHKVRDKIHSGFVLLTHPLYGSVKPYETMYRTVVLQEGKELDLDSLNLIEDAIAVTETFIRNKKIRHWSKSVMEDFQVIDLDLIEQTLQRFI